MTGTRLVLASSSPYRRQLLEKLGLAFDTSSPDCDETPQPGEAPGDLVTRLARDKALSVARGPESGGIVIGSDQVAELDGKVLTKPHTHARAREQLQASRGATVRFHTGLAVVDGRGADPAVHSVDCVTCEVAFRELTDEEIERYLAHEAPYDCAGSIRSEGYAITLFERLDAPDPNALVGLPLIRLCTRLRELGVPLP